MMYQWKNKVVLIVTINMQSFNTGLHSCVQVLHWLSVSHKNVEFLCIIVSEVNKFSQNFNIYAEKSLLWPTKQPPFYGHYTGQPALASTPRYERAFCWCKVLLPACPCCSYVFLVLCDVVNNRIKKSLLLNMWQSCKHECDCLVHFLCLLAVWRLSVVSAWDNHVLSCNFAKYLPVLIIFFTDRLSNKPFSLWLLTTSTHFKYVAILSPVPCNLSLIACFLTLMFHKISVTVWAHMQGVVGYLISSLLQILQRISEKMQIDNI